MPRNKRTTTRTSKKGNQHNCLLERRNECAITGDNPKTTWKFGWDTCKGIGFVIGGYLLWGVADYLSQATHEAYVAGLVGFPGITTAIIMGALFGLSVGLGVCGIFAWICAFWELYKQKDVVICTRHCTTTNAIKNGQLPRDKITGLES